MKNYITFTNSELEEELEQLKAEYEMLQNIVIEKYQLMMDLAMQYGEAEDVLNTRMGKKKEA